MLNPSDQAITDPSADSGRRGNGVGEYWNEADHRDAVAAVVRDPLIATELPVDHVGRERNHTAVVADRGVLAVGNGRRRGGVRNDRRRVADPVADRHEVRATRRAGVEHDKPAVGRDRGVGVEVRQGPPPPGSREISSAGSFACACAVSPPGRAALVTAATTSATRALPSTANRARVDRRWTDGDVLRAYAARTRSTSEKRVPLPARSGNATGAIVAPDWDDG